MGGVKIMNIREIERIIDEYHKNHKFLSGNKIQLMYELLTIFEDLCACSVMASILNPLALRRITDYMDSLNQALNWVENCESVFTDGVIQRTISEKRYEQGVSFLNDYAYPYSLICSGYVSYSRKRLSAKVEDNTVSFFFPDNANTSAWSDILREAGNTEFSSFTEALNPTQIMEANAKLQKEISIQDGQICYELNSEILSPFIEAAEGQWNATKTLPEYWKFDLFTLEEYKSVWIAIAALCYIHFFSCLTIKDPLARIENALIIQSPDGVIEYATSISNVKRETVGKIFNYLIYEPSKKNVDIMYQPIMKIDKDMILIAPMLFMGSRPERNLLAVVSSRSDFEHSKEVNDLENLMVKEIEEAIPANNKLLIKKHKKLGGRLPDIDLGIYDTVSNSVLLCELKWFMAADSSKEVYAREDEITHGCEQSEQIMGYAMNNKEHFIKQVFECDYRDNVDLFCCVVAKHNIRTQNKYVPVIDERKLIELLRSKPINSVFHIIRNHEYEEILPEDAEITFQNVSYAGFNFQIPAICFGTMME